MTSEVFFIKFPQQMNRAPEQVFCIDILGEGEVEINFRQMEAYFRKGDLLSGLRRKNFSAYSSVEFQKASKPGTGYYRDYTFENPMTGAKYLLMLSPHPLNPLDRVLPRIKQEVASTVYVVLNEQGNHVGELKFTGREMQYRVLH